jgi:hypothetical protein
MIFFTPIAYLDTFELASSLRTRMGQFPNPDASRRVLPLRGPRKDADPDDDAAFVLAREAQRWPELKAMLEQIREAVAQVYERLGKPGEVEFGRIALEMLMSGANVPWRKDDGAYAQRFERAHLALRSNPGARLFAAHEMLWLLPGDLTAVAHRVPHSAINLGEWPRVHLVVDFRRIDDA